MDRICCAACIFMLHRKRGDTPFILCDHVVTLLLHTHLPHHLGASGPSLFVREKKEREDDTHTSHLMT